MVLLKHSSHNMASASEADQIRLIRVTLSVSPCSPPLILEPLGGVVEAAGLGEHARGLGGHVVHALVQDPQPGLPFLTCSRPGSSNQPHNNLAIIPSYPTRNLRNTFDAICTFRAFGSTSDLKLHFVD